MTTVSGWAERAAAKLLGRQIVGVRYMTQKTAQACGWSRRAVVLELDDGMQIFPAADDEGNDAGALFTTDADLEIVPSI